MRESLQDLALNTKSSNSNLPSVSQTPCQQPFNCFNSLLIACILHLTTQKSSRCWKGDRQSLISGPRMKLGWLFSMFLRDNCSCSSLATHYHLAVHLLWFPAILKTNYYFLCVCVSVSAVLSVCDNARESAAARRGVMSMDGTGGMLEGLEFAGVELEYWIAGGNLSFIYSILGRSRDPPTKLYNRGCLCHCVVTRKLRQNRSHQNDKYCQWLALMSKCTSACHPLNVWN